MLRGLNLIPRGLPPMNNGEKVAECANVCEGVEERYTHTHTERERDGGKI
jgi:hypothetical protein